MKKKAADGLSDEFIKEALSSLPEYINENKEVIKEVLSSLHEYINENKEVIQNWFVENVPALLTRYEQLNQAQEEADRVLDLLEKGTIHDFNNLSVSGLALLIVCNDLDEKTQAKARKLVHKELSEKGTNSRVKNYKNADTILRTVYDNHIDSSLKVPRKAPQATAAVINYCNQQGIKITFKRGVIEKKIRKFQKESNACGSGEK